MPSILFIHENFPAQFGGIAVFLAKRGWKVVFGTAAQHVPSDGHDHLLLPGVHVVGYRAARGQSEAIHPYLASAEKAVLNGQAFARLGAALNKGGFIPDVVVAHSGWGSGSLARIVWPNAKFVQYLEWWYNIDAVDVEPEVRNRHQEDWAARSLCRNLPFLLDAQSADAILVPTKFQASQVPDFLQHNVTVLHDGVDGQFYRPKRSDDPLFECDGLPKGARFVSYATRGMEPMRGFPQFMAAWAKLQDKWPDLHCVIAGSDRVCYGAKLKGDLSYKKHLLRSFDFDMSRLHFTGLLPKIRYRSLLQNTLAHVYLTKPFVLSWSFIEAMMTGSPIVASRTQPVTEAALPDTVAYVEMDKPDEIAAGVSKLIGNQSGARMQGTRARELALANYSTETLYPKHEHFLLDVIGSRSHSKPISRVNYG